ncbi:protein phosphatase 1 regulatory subunit 36 [Parambassis ranga]|uniref:Protein phosphatase 1 regulatory subunit 36 n=1 Tax=Parambassis ranga TaxID=210632 RepID=A0A6P7I0K1_9TELE|nr:protein phosphatase 1 regulatory subunit 36 [Parambassis ranga]
MPKFPEGIKYVSVPPPGRWVWNDESQTLEFIRSGPVEEKVLRKKSQTNVSVNELHLRAEWLAEVCTLNRRGRQSIRNSLRPAHLDAYRSSVMERKGDRVTIHDVKQVAVGLLQENYLLPIPFCFLDILKSEELDDVLATLLLYLSCFFEHKSLEIKSAPLVVIDILREHQMMMETLAKKAIAQKKLAVCYFSLMMDQETKQHLSYHKGQVSSDRTEWLLHACLYCFFCYVAWVTFGRKDLRDIQEEVGRLLYSDTFNEAVRNRTDGDSRLTPTTINGSEKTGSGDPKETRHNGVFTQRTSQRHPALSTKVNQQSPLMASLLPSAKERSPHLFTSSRARSPSPLPAWRCDTKALAEQLDQQLASISFGILGKPLCQFSRSTLILSGGQRTSRDEEEDDEAGSDDNSSADPPRIQVQAPPDLMVSWHGPWSLVQSTDFQSDLSPGFVQADILL